MEIHAAMVDRMDREIGRVLDQLRAMGAWDNTLILFLSDNGASAEIMVRDDGHDPSAPAGSAGVAPLPGAGLVHGGQHAVPPPQDLGPRGRHLDPADRPLAARHRRPGRAAARPRPRHRPRADDPGSRRSAPARSGIGGGGRAPIPPLPGKSLVPAFARDGSVTHDAIWWEHEGNRAIRVGDWKLVAAKDQPWELYDLATDRTETRDLAAQQPEKVRELAGRWQRMHDEFAACARADAP